MYSEGEERVEVVFNIMGVVVEVVVFRGVFIVFVYFSFEFISFN